MEVHSRSGRRIIQRPPRADGGNLEFTESSYGNICNGVNFKNTRHQIK